MIRKILYFILVPVIILLVITCKDDQGVINDSITDVSSRIISIPDTVGTGDTIFIEGTDFGDLIRVICGEDAVPRQNIIFTSNGIKFRMPQSLSNGMNVIVLVFPDFARASDSIYVAARQIISYLSQNYGHPGDTITVYGRNLNVVDYLLLGDVEAEIISQPGELLTFIVPSGAYPDVLRLHSEDFGFVDTDDEFIACEHSTEFVCLTNLILNGDGGFELGTLGDMTTDGSLSSTGNWYAAGVNGVSSDRQVIEIVSTSTLPNSDWPGLGELSAKITPSTAFLTGSSFTDFWQVQIVNTVDPVDTGRLFMIVVNVWSDLPGRKFRVHGGVSRPGYTDMGGATEFVLRNGWNQLSVDSVYHVSGQEDNHVRVQLSYGYAENVGATFYLDDVRLYNIGSREEYLESIGQ